MKEERVRRRNEADHKGIGIYDRTIYMTGPYIYDRTIYMVLSYI